MNVERFMTTILVFHNGQRQQTKHLKTAATLVKLNRSCVIKIPQNLKHNHTLHISLYSGQQLLEDLIPLLCELSELFAELFMSKINEAQKVREFVFARLFLCCSSVCWQLILDHLKV